MQKKLKWLWKCSAKISTGCASTVCMSVTFFMVSVHWVNDITHFWSALSQNATIIFTVVDQYRLYFLKPPLLIFLSWFLLFYVAQCISPLPDLLEPDFFGHIKFQLNLATVISHWPTGSEAGISSVSIGSKQTLLFQWTLTMHWMKRIDSINTVRG